MKKYEAAIEAHNEAIRKFEPFKLAYRNLEIGDEEFLAARAEYTAATEVFDRAYAEASAHKGECS